MGRKIPNDEFLWGERDGITAPGAGGSVGTQGQCGKLSSALPKPLVLPLKCNRCKWPTSWWVLEVAQSEIH